MKSFISNIYVKTLLIAAAVLIITCAATLKWLETYTRHGSSIEIPDISGLTVDSAAQRLAVHNITYQITDSAFQKDLPIGVIIETIPAAGSKVKEGCTIFLRINSDKVRLTSLPDVENSSQRQAETILRSNGIKNITVRIVPGQHRDLVTGLEIRGQAVQAGEKVPPDVQLTILVSSGLGEPDIDDIINDTIVNIEHDDGENWY
jgi:beta-lactam-binding protein with PASTA domain